MKIECHKSRLVGTMEVPGSKSHTIRAVVIGSLADGVSRISAPLVSGDTLAAVEAYRSLGARIETGDQTWDIQGTGGRLVPPPDMIDVRNSGTTLRLAVGSAALLSKGQATFKGDDQIQRRPIGPLLASLNDLGAKAQSIHANGCAPVTIGGPLRGGRTRIEAVTSQYVSSLLLSCPLADGESEIDVTLLNEAPYVQITLDWLNRSGIRLEHEDVRRFRIEGGQAYRPIDVRVPADFSSATFFLGAGALDDNDITLRGLDFNDTQGDKAVVDYLKEMGARIDVEDDRIRVRPGPLRGCEIDLNATPDSLPMMAVMGCFAEGRTRLANVPQARVKETDRIAIMAAELSKLGADVRELEDGLVVGQSRLTAADVDGHHDHRVVMALAVAGCAIEGSTTVSTAEAVDVTFPTYAQCMTSLGADLRVVNDD